MYRYQYSDEDLQKLKELSAKVAHANQMFFMFNNMTAWDDALRLKALFVQ